MPDDQTSDTTDPKGSAAGGAEGGAASGKPSGDQGAASAGGKPSDEAAALKAENERLTRELARATGKAGSDKASLESRVAAIEARATAAEAEAAGLKREKKANATADAIVAEVPEPHRAIARAIVRGYGSDGIDLAAEDQAATAKTVLARLGKEFPDLMKPPENRPTIPRIGNVQNGQPKAESIGLTAQGVKVL